MATIDKGVGRLVDADMNEVSTRLLALQTQEQLAYSRCRLQTRTPRTFRSSSDRWHYAAACA
ncbi:flagellin [Rhizobium sp. ARZ01]|uniref:flagellin n=1 Tax=Rhizobium sp. ARZ01 TaxID=2769313 RepID=UPI001FEEB0FF|nr:flagellin [Rhizobium sp. ARZ01]